MRNKQKADYSSISHTIAAVLLVPIAERIGDSLGEPHPRLLIMVSGPGCTKKYETFADHKGHRPHLFRGYGSACIWVPQYDCVSLFSSVKIDLR
jgi:hypothetical protein